MKTGKEIVIDAFNHLDDTDSLQAFKPHIVEWLGNVVHHYVYNTQIVDLMDDIIFDFENALSKSTILYVDNILVYNYLQHNKKFYDELEMSIHRTIAESLFDTQNEAGAILASAMQNDQF